MKQQIILWIGVLLLLIGGVGCKKDQSSCCDKEIIKDVSELTGIISYNTEVKRWYISVSDPNSYDNVTLYFCPVLKKVDSCSCSCSYCFFFLS